MCDVARTGIRITSMDLSGFQRIKNEDIVNKLGAALAEEMTSDIVKSFDTSPPGRQWWIASEGFLHTASLPGFPPNVLSIELLKSMNWEKIRDGIWHVQDGVEHGIKMEQGEPETNTAPRPFVGPVFANKGRWKAFMIQFVRTRIR